MEKVFVVFDPLFEEVISVHKTEDGALERVEEQNFIKERITGDHYSVEYNKYDLED